VSAPVRSRGAYAPLLAVGAVLLLLALLAGVVDLDHAALPKPPFRDLALKGYPADTPLKDAALIVEAALWWLCLSFVLWVAGLVAIALCWRQLRRATQHDAALGRTAMRCFVAAIVLAAGVLAVVAVVREAPLMSFSLLVDNLDLMSHGFVRLAALNTALAWVVGPMLLLGLSLLLLPGAFADVTMQQVQAITRVMYVGAAFLLVWISAATAMYRLAAMLLVAEAREPALKLAPTISLMGGLFLSLLLAAAYLSACAWLQHRHEHVLANGDGQAKAGESPQAFLAAHWPKVIAILMPLLPGAAGSVLQAVTQAP
jgi:hypothetical protein